MGEILHHGRLLADELGNLCGTHKFGKLKEKWRNKQGIISKKGKKEIPCRGATRGESMSLPTAAIGEGPERGDQECDSLRDPGTR